MDFFGDTQFLFQNLLAIMTLVKATRWCTEHTTEDIDIRMGECEQVFLDNYPFQGKPIFFRTHKPPNFY